MAKNLVLIGMPGSGKTTIGQLLAAKLSMDFIDIDDVIESYGMTIDELFESGEDAFRCVETMAVKDVASHHDLIIATGGGVVTREENIHYLKQTGFIFFLDRSLDKIKKDLAHDKTRPLLANDLSALDALYDKRFNLYNKYADIVIDSNVSVYMVADAVAKAYRELTSK